jgi:hypothetical protein
MNTQTAIFSDTGCLGNSYPQMGQISAFESTSIAQPGHSFFFICLSNLGFKFFLLTIFCYSRNGIKPITKYKKLWQDKDQAEM